MHYLSVIDVGHGNCAFISSDGRNVVIDAASRTHLVRYLESRSIVEIDLVVISHADEDHIGGLVNLLSSTDIRVKKLVINSDAQKNSILWEDVRSLVDGRYYQGQLDVKIGAYAKEVGQEWTKVSDRLRLEVISPSLAMAMGGPGTALPGEKKSATSNSASIVLRILFDENPVAFFSADMDELAFEDILRLGLDLQAKYLVYPHHGGLPGRGDAKKFADAVLSAVKPETVLFSNGRGRHNNPRPEIVSAIRASFPTVYVACTQLSRMCCSSAVVRSDYTPTGYSAGIESNGFCAGSFEIDLESCRPRAEQVAAHKAFVQGLAEAMCASDKIIAKI